MYLLVKRTFDIAVSALGLIVASPLIAVLVISVKQTSPGPVLYHGRRVGRHEKVFELLKFRTMVQNAERLGGSATANDDFRLTAFGKKIRRWKLDELPQLWNVLVGEMSLVGPRPDVVQYAAAYSKAERRVFTVRPGLTDWATIWNSDEGAVLAGSTDPERLYKEVIRPIKTELQLLYCDRRSFLVDIKILWHTAMKLVDSHWVPKELAGYGTSLHMGPNCDRVRNASSVS